MTVLAAPVFAYPLQPQVRRHGPAGYVDYTSYKDWLRDEFAFRCVYCQERERWYPNGCAAFGVEHTKPKSKPEYQALICVYDSLVYACNRCNVSKRDRELLDPCATALGEHLRFQTDGRIEGLTKEGAWLIESLDLNAFPALDNRRLILRLFTFLQTQPDNTEAVALLHHFFGFPDDLPDLSSLRPPSNTRPEGVADCYYRQKVERRLPPLY